MTDQQPLDPARPIVDRALIGGAWQGADGDAEMDVRNPSTDDLNATVPRCGHSDVVRAIDAASAALPAWRARRAHERANDTEFGLAAYFYTRDASRVIRVSEALEYGVVKANEALPSTPQAPFGGMKGSGLGREGGRYGLDLFLRAKYVSAGLASAD